MARLDEQGLSLLKSNLEANFVPKKMLAATGPGQVLASTELEPGVFVPQMRALAIGDLPLVGEAGGLVVFDENNNVSVPGDIYSGGTKLNRSNAISFTPYLGGTTADGSYTYTSRSGSVYVFNGFAYVRGSLTIDTIVTAATGGIAIKGFPYAAIADSYLVNYGAQTKAALGSGYTQMQGQVNANRLRVMIFNPTTGSYGAYSPDNIVSGTRFEFTAIYPI